MAIDPMMLEALALAAPGPVGFVAPLKFEAARVQVANDDDVERSGAMWLGVTRAAPGCGDDAAELVRVTRFDRGGRELLDVKSLRQLRAEREEDRALGEVERGA